MLEQRARVVHSSGQGIWVEAAEPDGCGVCEGQGCTSRRLAELFQRTPRLYAVESSLRLLPGDNVIVGIPEGRVLRSAIYLYGMPLMLMLGGALLFQAWLPGDAGSVAGALTGVFVAGAVIASISRKHRFGHQPVVIRRLVSASIVEEEK